VQTGEIVIGGLSMPHSPRLYGGRLWVLNSGTGELGWIEPGAGAAGAAKFHALAFCRRGLDQVAPLRIIRLVKSTELKFDGALKWSILLSLGRRTGAKCQVAP
jgi:hypothetical protein